MNGLRNVNGAEPRHYQSNVPAATPPETPACVGGSRWLIEMEFETEKSDVGLDEYKTRSRTGWHHHIPMRLPVGAFLIGLQQAWGARDAPGRPSTGVPVVRAMPPRARPGPDGLLRNKRAFPSRERRRSARHEGRLELPA